MSGVRLIVCTLLGRWLQRCVISLSLLQQLVLFFLLLLLLLLLSSDEPARPCILANTTSRHRQTLSKKIAVLRAELNKLQPRHKRCVIPVSRTNILEVANRSFCGIPFFHVCCLCRYSYLFVFFYKQDNSQIVVGVFL